MKKSQQSNLLDQLIKKFYWLIILSSIAFTGCKKETAPKTQVEEQAGIVEKTLSAERGIPHVVVRRGKSIQAAIDAANSPTIIFIEPGTYKEPLVVDKPGIQLIGLNNSEAYNAETEIIILNRGEDDNGITVTDNGDGFVLRFVTVKNFIDNGVYLEKVDGFVLDHVKAVNNKEYGLFPVLSNHGLIEHCSATGSSDTGIYVGQSTNVVVRYCTAFGNVSGFEIENCTNVKAVWNEAYDNAAGMLVFLLPQLTVKIADYNTLSNNYVHHNNHINFAPPGGGFEVFIPSGSGILLVGADHTTISKNTINNNNFLGIAVVSDYLLGALANIPPDGFADIEPFPDENRIVQNTLKDNGSMPPPLGLPGVDLFWDGSGVNNCWKNNTFSSSFPAALPSCL